MSKKVDAIKFVLNMFVKEVGPEVVEVVLDVIKKKTRKKKAKVEAGSE